MGLKHLYITFIANNYHLIYYNGYLITINIKVPKSNNLKKKIENDFKTYLQNKNDVRKNVPTNWQKDRTS